jgi:hypothetical protein
MEPQLAAVEQQLVSTSRAARELIESTPADALGFHPTPGAWSPLQCLVHLNLTSEAYLPLLERALDTATARSHGPFRLGALGRLLLWILEPPYRMRVRTQPAFQPSEADPPLRVLAHFEHLQAELQALVRRADGIALDRIAVVSPFDPRVRYNAIATLLILPAHQRRHLWQARQVLALRR